MSLWLQGSGVAIGATDGLTGWSLDAKPGNRIGVYKSENNSLQRVTLGFDPRTGFGQLVGEIGEIMVFDQNLSPGETEKVEGYLAHKWGVVDDLTQTGYKIRENLILYYPFNETDGSVVRTIQLESRDAEAIDASLDTDGKFGSGILLMPDMNESKIYQKVIGFHLNSKSWTISTWFLPITDGGCKLFMPFIMTFRNHMLHLVTVRKDSSFTMVIPFSIQIIFLIMLLVGIILWLLVRQMVWISTSMVF